MAAQDRSFECEPEDSISHLQGSSPNSPAQEFSYISIDLLDSHRDQPRAEIGRASLEELIASVRVHGILQPIRIRRCGVRYELIAGHRRVAAAREAGLEKVPAVVVEATNERALVESLIENIQREDLSAVDRAKALRRLRSCTGAQSWEEVGQLIGVSRRHVHHLLNVSGLPEQMRDEIASGKLTEKHGRALSRLRNHPDLRNQLWRQIATQGLSGDDALATARSLVRAQTTVSHGATDRNNHQVSLPSLQQALIVLLRTLPQASMAEVRPLRRDLEALSKRLTEILCDAFADD